MFNAEAGFWGGGFSGIGGSGFRVGNFKAWRVKVMSPDGEIKKMAEFVEEHGKSEKELKNDGFISLTDEEHTRMEKLPEKERMAALKNMRFADVRTAALSAQGALRKKDLNKSKNKNRAKMIKASKRKNRKNR